MKRVCLAFAIAGIFGASAYGQPALTPPANSFVINDNAGTAVAYIDSDGNLGIAGVVVPNASASLRVNTSASEFIVRVPSGGGFEIVAVMDPTYVEDTQNPNDTIWPTLYLKGQINEEQTSLSPPANSLIIRDTTEAVVAYVDSSGNLFLKGEILPRPQVEFAQTGANVNESAGGANLDVVLTRPYSFTVVADYDVTAGDAQENGVDFDLPSMQSVTFLPGEVSQTISVSITDDTHHEDTESATLTLSSPVEATLGSPDDFVMSILDDDDVNLIISSSTPMSATPSVTYPGHGDTITLSWTVENSGTTTPQDTWTDKIFLSRDDAYQSADDKLVHTETGSTEGTMQAQIPLPDVGPGAYYLIVVADIDNEQGETNDGDNVGAIDITVFDKSFVFGP